MFGRRPNCCPIAFRLISWIHCPLWSVFIHRLRKLITAVEGHYPSLHTCGNLNPEANGKTVTRIDVHLTAYKFFGRHASRRSCIQPLRIIHSTPKPATMSPFHHHLRGHCHGTNPLFLPTRARGAGVRLPDALLAVAPRRRFPSPADRANHAIPT